MPGKSHSKHRETRGHETVKDLVYFKTEYPVWLLSELKDVEKG